MNVSNIPIYQFLEGSGKKFVIPVYQRDYSWTKKQCNKLWDDIKDLYRFKREDHFIGTIVTIGSGNFEEYTIIDGQQRLTTISILLLALKNYLSNSNIEDKEKIQEQILDFLENKYSEGEKRIRLKPNKSDKEHFEKLFSNEKNLDINSNIISNYNFFYEMISSGELNPIVIFNAFKKLKIVLISLIRGQDDPQLIFESLNSTGVDLTAGDLIRNYMLMDLEQIQQERIYKSHWVKIDDLTGDIAEFIRNYLLYKTEKAVKKENVYDIFKEFSVKSFKKNNIQLMDELLQFAEIYGQIIKSKEHPDLKINEQLNRISKLEFTVCYPYLIELLYANKIKKLNSKTVCEAIRLIESYAFRKIIVDNTTQGLNIFFITFGRDIRKESKYDENYLEVLKYILLERKASQRYPTDSEFENALIYKKIYEMQSKNKNFLLESLENFDSDYMININNMTIEHIMPQTLTEKWKKTLGESWKEIHEKYLHTLGNLSLTANNTQLSNKTLEEKQRIDYQINKLKLNYKLDTIEEWNETKIKERAKELANIAIKIWTHPKTSYTKKIGTEKIFDLNSEDDFSGFKPAKIYFEENSKGTLLKSWRDLIIKTCSFLYNYSPTEFNEIQNNPNFEHYFGTDRKLRCPIEFMPDKFVEGNISANESIKFLSKLCEKINYPKENIQFSLKNNNLCV